jgi:hypothetical protein
MIGHRKRRVNLGISGFISEGQAEILTTRMLTLREPPTIEIVTLSTTEVELRLGVFDRKAVQIDNDTSYLIYIGFTNPFLLADSITLLSGNSITFNFLNDFDIFAKLEQGTTFTKIIETS